MTKIIKPKTASDIVSEYKEDEMLRKHVPNRAERRKMKAKRRKAVKEAQRSNSEINLLDEQIEKLDAISRHLESTYGGKVNRSQTIQFLIEAFTDALKEGTNGKP